MIIRWSFRRAGARDVEITVEAVIGDGDDASELGVLAGRRAAEFALAAANELDRIANGTGKDIA